MPHNECWSKVRVPLGRRSQRQNSFEGKCRGVHRFPDDLGGELAEQREDLPVRSRSALPEELHEYNQGDLQETIQGVRAYLSHPLPTHYAPWGRDSPQHLLQAFHLFY